MGVSLQYDEISSGGTTAGHLGGAANIANKKIKCFVMNFVSISDVTIILLVSGTFLVAIVVRICPEKRINLADCQLFDCEIHHELVGECTVVIIYGTQVFLDNRAEVLEL